ncbi:TonB-dependent hemoglobin/transferrin/lactoferrin family receptor [Shimia sp. NS0008-38b]|uniref:TonB-dependent receptor domain-containing protein n=1 Tax=Shimia sp. NS0008-38b TaxID=3127653 RepID=UPI00310B8041
MRARTSIRTALMCGAAAIIASPVWAQDNDTVIELDPIFLGKSKREVQTDIAESETVIGQEEMNDRQASTIAELVDSVPGVTLINGASPQGSGINIRGFGANPTYGSDQKVLIQIDGASVGSEELYRIGTQLYTDPELYKEVTVLRGMGGSYEYGSGAIGGTILLETKDASDFTNGELGFRFRETLQYNSNGDGFTSSSILAWQPTEDFEVLGNYTYRNQGLQTDGSGAIIGNSDFSLPSAALKLRKFFGDAKEHRFELSLSDTNSEALDVPYDSFGTTTDSFGNVDRFTHTQTGVLTYGYNPADNDLIDLSVVLSYANQEIEQSYVAGSSSLEGTPSFPFLLPLVEADHQYETTKLTVKNASTFATGNVTHNMRYGAEFSQRDRLDASSAPGGTDERLALFLVDEMDFGNGLILTPGVRYEDQHIGGSGTYYDNSALMGGISAYYGFQSGWGVFGSAGYTENMPIIDDLGTAAYMTQPEKGRNFELGFSFDNASVFSESDQLGFKVTGYKTDVWDVTSYSHTVGTTSYPVTEINTRGLEIEGRYAHASGAYVDLNANIQRGTFRAPTAPAGDQNGDWRGIPADQLRLTLGKRWGETIDLSWEIVADANMSRSTSPTPSQVVNNVRATFRPQSGVLEGAEVRVGLENVFDELYTPHLATRPAPGRTLKLSLAKTF